MTASHGATHSRYKLRCDRRSLSYGSRSIIRLISFMNLVMGQCVGDTPSGFTIPKFESLANFSYKSPRDSDGRPVQISADTLLLTPDPIATVTSHELHYIGRIVYNQAFQFIPSDGSSSSKEARSFSSSLTFKILTTSSYGRCGDGLAFFITSDFEAPLNSTGRYLGLQSQLPSSPAALKMSSRFFAVEFDTFQNLDFGDPSASHIAFNINSLNSSAVLDTSGNNSCCREMKNKDENPGQCPFCDDEPHHQNKPGVQSQFDNKDRAVFVKSSYPELFLYNNYTFSAWIEYDAPTHLIQLWMTNQSTAQRPPDPSLSMIYNLSKIFLPQMYVGISAASGNNFEGTTIYSWNFTLHGNESKAKNIKSKASRNKKMFTIVVSFVITMLILAGVAVCIRLVVAKSRKRTRKILKKRRTLERLPHIQIESIVVPRYSYKSLKRAAHSFREGNKVGEGGFSSVYKGKLEDGRQVAVKKLKNGVTMEAEFTSEVQIISQIRHRNLLQLQGWCYEKGEALLVYQFMPNGSLDSYLFGSKRESHGLDSETRFKVLTGVAAALEYLHNGLGGCVLHRDVKAANVLLTDKFEPMLGDFGLARLISHDQSGTRTYLDDPAPVKTVENEQ